MQEKSDFSSKFFVYVLFSLRDQRLYVGYTTDLELRLVQHDSGKVTSTRLRRPLRLIYYEVFTNKDDAKTREIFLKSGFGRGQLKLALKKTLSELGYKYL